MSWYRTGTINLTKDSANVTGVNTKWAQSVNGVMPGMIMITPDNKFYEIKNVVSDTSLVLVTAYSGATAAAQAYAVVTTYEGDLSQFSARFSALLTAMGGSRTDMYNFLTSTAATINVSKDDGTTVSVKTLKAFTDEQAKFATKNADGVIPIEQGGTGGKTAADIRKNADLGTSATKDVGTAAGNVMQVGAFGIGGSGVSNLKSPDNASFISMLKDTYRGGVIFRPAFGADQKHSLHPNGISLYMRGGDVNAVISTRFENGDLKILTATDTGLVNGSVKENIIYGTANTTKAADGTLKSASPVVKIFHDGKFETNDESDGCSVSRIAIGEYLIEGCLGMNADASWGGVDGGFDIPKDRNGQPLIWLDFRVNADGSILVKTYHRTYPNSPTFAQNNIEGLKDGDPADIPADQFVSVRVEMPIDSIWNQKQAAIQAESEALQPGYQEE